MNYIVMDLEWNQGADDTHTVNGLPFEIIEIGAVRLNAQSKQTGEFRRLICPQVYREMHYVTRNLIHLNMEELKKGRPFIEVIEEFFDWCGEDYIFCTWGSMDLTELQRNMRFYGMPPLAGGPFRFYDVQKLFSIAFEDGKSRKTLEYAADYLLEKKEAPFHRAFEDASYTAKIFGQLSPEVLHNYSFNVFHLSETKKEEIKIVFDDYAKYISRGFTSKSELLADREVMSTKCYFCHKNIKRKMRWFTPNGKHYYCLACCDEHGFMKAKVRIRKSDNGMIYAVKTSKFITGDEVDAIMEKQQKVSRQKGMRED